MVTKGIVLSLCDFTGNMCRPWADAGYECVAVDVKHRQQAIPIVIGNGSIEYRYGDVTKMGLGSSVVPIKAVFAFPPCTDLAVSGARYFKDKGMQRLIDALKIVEACRLLCEHAGVPYMIENPVSTLSTYWRKPDYVFDPCDYGGYLNPPVDAYTKKTCLWAGGGFIMPKPKRVSPTEGSKMHLMSPGENRAALRSETPTGFAEAVFQANHNEDGENADAR